MKLRLLLAIPLLSLILAVSALAGHSSFNFVENKGQWTKNVSFVAKSKDMKLLCTQDALIFDYFKNEKVGNTVKSVGTVLSMSLSNSNPIRFVGDEKEKYYHNYFLGKDPSRWVANVGIYRKLIAQNVYEGIDLIVLESGNSPRYDFVVEAGADPNAIRLKFEGADDVRVEDKSLVIRLGSRTIEHSGIYAYQKVNGTTNQINCRFVEKNGSIGFVVEDYDRSLPMVIDPTIFSTYWGGSSTDEIKGVKIDNNGDLLVSGSTTSDDFRFSVGAYDTTYASFSDIFVSKFKIKNVTRELLFSTYIGGLNDDVANGVGFDQENNIYVAGWTDSKEYPVKTAYQALPNGKKDACITKLNPTGTEIIYSSYVGGKNDDMANAMDVTPEGYVYITGGTYSSDFPVISGDVMQYSGQEDAFLFKMGTGGSQPIFGTFFGTSGSADRGTAIAVNESQDIVLIALETNGSFSQYYQWAQVVDRNANGGMDVMLVKFRKSGSERRWYNFYGGMNDETAHAIFIDVDGTFYVGGTTKSNISSVNPSATSNNFPIGNTAYQSAFAGGASDAFFASFEEDAKIRYASTYLGGSGDETITGLSKNPITGNIIAVGYTTSSNFPLANPDGQPSLAGGTDIFIAELSKTGSTLEFSSLWGANKNEFAYGMALDKNASVYVAGVTNSDKWSLSDPFQSKYGGGSSDGFIFKYTPTTLTLNNPRNNDEFCLGSVMNIEWDWTGYLDGTKFNVFLYDSLANTYTQIANDISNASYKWTIPTNFEAGKKYKIAIATDLAQYVTNEGLFSFKAAPKLVSATASEENLSLCEGGILSFSVVAEGNGLTYQWTKNGTNINGKNQSSLSFASLSKADAGSYVCVIKNGCSPDVSTSPFVVNVLSAPIIKKDIESLEALENTEVIFTIEAEGDDLKYTWDRNGIRMLGEVSNKLTLTNVQKSNEGSYKCNITGTCGTSSSKEAVLTVKKNGSVADRFNTKQFKLESINVSNSIASIKIISENYCSTVINIVDVSGREVYSQDLHIEAGANYLDINIGSLPSGTYIINAICGNYSAGTKFNILK